MVNKKETNVKNKKRVRDFGEVFTPQWLVEEMLNLSGVKESCENIETTFLEPSAGEGAFLIAILKHKLETVSIFYNNDIKQYEQYSLDALSTLYGVELLQDNVEKCKANLFETYLNYYNKACTKHNVNNVNDNILNRVNTIIDINIQQGDFLIIYKEIYKNVKFDVVIGNPPYHLNVGNIAGNSSKSKAIYHKFIEMAKELHPKYITMIIPSRWMTKSADGVPDKWVDDMINTNKIRVIHDFLNSKECFPDVDIKGGVCYFLWDNQYNGKCDYYLHDGDNEKDVVPINNYLNYKNLGIIVRDNFAISILDKIQKVEGNYITNINKNFSGLVSPKDLFTNKTSLTSKWKGYSKIKDEEHDIKYYLNKNTHKIQNGYIKLDDIPKNKCSVKFHKVYIPASSGTGSDKLILGKPFYGEPNSACSQTYLVIGYNHDLTKEQCHNIISYIQTKFFRYIVSIKKKTQCVSRKVYEFVPMQDFSKSWNDQELYEKYGLSQDEINYIESMIRPMKTDNRE